MMTTKLTKKRIFYLDALRAFAIISVIIFHVFLGAEKRSLVFYLSNPSFQWFFSTIMRNSFRIGVDLFLMLSGALSLGRVWDIRTFLGKRILRIALPFVFWGFVLSLVTIGYAMIFPHTFVALDQFNVLGFLDYLAHSYLDDNLGFGPYWFFWMILGTYLFMPILNKWLLHCDLREVEYFLVFWAVTCIFTYTLDVEFPVKLMYFSGPIGFVVLGYYLRHNENKILNNPYFAMFLVVLSVLLVYFVTTSLTTPDKFYSMTRYDILLVIEVIGVFMLFKNFSKISPVSLSQDSIFKKSVFSIAKYSYGIYLIHQVIICIIRFNLEPYLGFSSSIIVDIVLTLLVSWAVMALLNRIPYLNRVIGAK